MEIIALVKFNDKVAMVLDESPKLIYRKVGNSILGTDGTFLQTYVYERPDERWKAFAGSKFDLPLADGTIEHCYGQWWDGINDQHRKMVDGKIVSVTAACIDDLRNCYVYIGYKGIEHKIQELISNYKGLVYEYRDFEMLITKNKYRRRKHRLIPVLRKLRRQKRLLHKTGKQQ